VASLQRRKDFGRDDGSGETPSNVEVLQKLSKAFGEFLEGLPSWCPAKQALYGQQLRDDPPQDISSPKSRDTTITEIPKIVTAMSPGTESSLGESGSSSDI
jgi:hypothetical protein